MPSSIPNLWTSGRADEPKVPVFFLMGLRVSSNSMPVLVIFMKLLSRSDQKRISRTKYFQNTSM